MKLENVREYYEYFSGKISDIVRQLGLAGIALIWVFKTEVAGKQVIPADLMTSAKLIVMALGLDLLHYITGTIVWGSYNSIKERQGIKQDKEFLAPRKINWPALFFFWTKIFTMLAAYVYILRFLLSHVTPI